MPTATPPCAAHLPGRRPPALEPTPLCLDPHPPAFQSSCYWRQSAAVAPAALFGVGGSSPNCHPGSAHGRQWGPQLGFSGLGPLNQCRHPQPPRRSPAVRASRRGSNSRSEVPETPRVALLWATRAATDPRRRQTASSLLPPGCRQCPRLKVRATLSCALIGFYRGSAKGLLLAPLFRRRSPC